MALPIKPPYPPMGALTVDQIPQAQSLAPEQRSENVHDGSGETKWPWITGGILNSPRDLEKKSLD
jgi:hypothetical protein